MKKYISNNNKQIGPSLPPHLMTKSDNNEEDDDNDYVIGPLPSDKTDPKHSNETRIIKINKDNEPKREKWMLEPGKVMKSSLPQTKSITKFNQK